MANEEIWKERQVSVSYILLYYAYLIVEKGYVRVESEMGEKHPSDEAGDGGGLKRANCEKRGSSLVAFDHDGFSASRIRMTGTTSE